LTDRLVDVGSIEFVNHQPSILLDGLQNLAGAELEDLSRVIL
jgi:hypothetical protein